MDDERGYVFFSEFTAHESIDVLRPLLDFGLPHKMAIGFHILVQLLRAESHLTHPLTVAAEHNHDCTVGDRGNSGIRSEMFFDYLLDPVADTTRFVDGGYHSSGSDLKVQCGSGAVVVVVWILSLALEQVIAPVALLFITDVGCYGLHGFEVHHLFC